MEKIMQYIAGGRTQSKNMIRRPWIMMKNYCQALEKYFEHTYPCKIKQSTMNTLLSNENL